MSRASEYAIALFRQSYGPLRCLAASDPCGRRAGKSHASSGTQPGTPILRLKQRDREPKALPDRIAIWDKAFQHSLGA
jgi:hypothetical protein